MRPTGIGRLLLGIGSAVGVLAGVGLLIGFDPARLPPAILNIAAYKLTFVAALGLIAAGAAVVRYGREATRNERDSRRPEVRQLGEGAAPEPPLDARRARERELEREPERERERERGREPRA